MSPIGAGQRKSRALPEFSHPCLSLQNNVVRIHTAHFHPSCMYDDPWVFLKLGVSCLQQLWRLLPAANDDIFWVTHVFDGGFMDTFAFGQTNLQIGHNCINSQATAEEKPTLLRLTAACWTAVLRSEEHVFPVLAKLLLSLVLSTTL